MSKGVYDKEGIKDPNAQHTTDEGFENGFCVRSECGFFNIRMNAPHEGHDTSDICQDGPGVRLSAEEKFTCSRKYIPY